MKKIKDSLITVEQVSDYLNDFSLSDVLDGIINGATFMFILMINIILFPIVIFRFLKKN